MSCDELAADWALRIKGLNLGVVVRDAVRRSFGLQTDNEGATGQRYLTPQVVPFSLG